MRTLAASFIPQIAKLVTDHLYAVVSGVAVFVLGVFVKEPIKRWWQRHGKLGEARKAMYQDLAEICAEMGFFTGAVNQALSNQSVAPGHLTRLVESFYERIKSHDYEADLKTLRSFRTSMDAEVRGFESVTRLMNNLPGAHAPILEKTQALIDFNQKFAQAIATEHFDSKRLSLALIPVQQEEWFRHVKRVFTTLQQGPTAAKQTDEAIAELDQRVAQDTAEIEAAKAVLAKQ